MELYLIEYPEVGWDMFFGFVIASYNSDQAIRMAYETSYQPTNLGHVKHIGKYEGDKTEPHIILESYNAS